MPASISMVDNVFLSQGDQCCVWEHKRCMRLGHPGVSIPAGPMHRAGLNSTVTRGKRGEDLGLFKTILEMITTEKKLGHLPKLRKTKQIHK